MAASFPTAIKNFSAIANGITKLVAALFNSPYDEITAIETALGVNMVNVRLGAWVDKSASYAAQQAATDGFLVVWGLLNGAGEYFQIFTDANADPTTVRTRCYLGTTDITIYTSATCPVKKNDYWKLVLTGGATIDGVYFIPFGN